MIRQADARRTGQHCVAAEIFVYTQKSKCKKEEKIPIRKLIDHDTAGRTDNCAKIDRPVHKR